MTCLHKKKGFTLIELLVVVAIIGVLASLVLSRLSDVRAKTQDTRQLTRVKAMQQALELYYLDNGVYPGDDTWSTFSHSGAEQHLASRFPQHDVFGVGSVWYDNWVLLEAELREYLPNELEIDDNQADQGLHYVKGGYFREIGVCPNETGDAYTLALASNTFFPGLEQAATEPTVFEYSYCIYSG